MKPISKFDRATCEQVRKAVDAAIADVGTKYGLKMTTGRGKYRDMHFSIQVEASIMDESGTDLSEKTDFEMYAKAYGLSPDIFGKTFTQRDGSFRVVGLNLRSDKMPVKCVRIQDGKHFKFAVKAVLPHFTA